MLKIAIIGPESTGKSELSKKLADYFQCEWVPEFAREYVENLDRPYTFEDVCKIAENQIQQEVKYEKAEKEIVIFDTELIITKVWFLYCYNECPQFLQDQLDKKYFDMYLLCAPDLPWEPDPVREHGSDRDYFFNWYKKEIEILNKPYFVVTGLGDERTKNAIDIIENHKIKLNI